MNTVRAALKLTILGIWTFALIPVQAVCIVLNARFPDLQVTRLYHKSACRILGIRLNVVGAPSPDSHVFYVGNHLSHFDIFILGSILRASFVAKEEIANWPLFGTLARLQECAFISRRPNEAEKVKTQVDALIRSGKNVILFPEGTSTRGNEVLPFKSSLFSLPLLFGAQGLTLQPFSIVLQGVDGKRVLTPGLRDLYAWDRDNEMPIFQHIWNFAKTSGAELDLIFHAETAVPPGEDRKSLASRIQAIVAEPVTSRL